MEEEDIDSLPGPTARISMFWMALSQGRQEDVGKYLARAGYTSVFDAMRDLQEDVEAAAMDLRARQEIEPAVQMEALAAEIASYLSPH